MNPIKSLLNLHLLLVKPRVSVQVKSPCSRVLLVKSQFCYSNPPVLLEKSPPLRVRCVEPRAPPDFPSTAPRPAASPAGRPAKAGMSLLMAPPTFHDGF